MGGGVNNDKNKDMEPLADHDIRVALDTEVEWATASDFAMNCQLVGAFPKCCTAPDVSLLLLVSFSFVGGGAVR